MTIEDTLKNLLEGPNGEEYRKVLALDSMPRTQPKEIKQRLRRCDLCHAVEMEGQLVPLGEYDQNEFDYSDASLSYECAAKLYGKEMADRLLQRAERDNQPLYDSCPTQSDQ